LNRAFIAVFGIAVFAAILFGSLAFDSVLAAKEPKVLICHVDPDGDGAGLETLEVNGHSLAKHLAHGDHVGACFVCGDGFQEGAEQCDDGGESLTCDADCTAAVCGDGTVNPTAGEICDDGGESLTCDADCTAAVCGDGTVNPTAGEECDDGNTNDNDSCTNQCTTAVCGDDIVGPGEQCDGSALDGMTCIGLTGNAGPLACDSSCDFDLSGCIED